tara:strand:+ start:2488 stop:2682 length:195 start_codon:yes stop_codon:yes gene_type:complete
MNAEEMGVLFGGISSILAVLIYFTKNIRESECMGSRCSQAIVETRLQTPMDENLQTQKGNISMV